jgi:type VI secretion system protein VasD
MTDRNRIFAKLLVLVAAFALVACAAKPPEDVQIKGTIEAVASVNPDSLGRPSPLQVKIFQLSAKDKFEAADYFALSDASEATLGADMLGVQAMMLSPGDHKPYEGEFDPATRFIGVIAGYREIHQAQWRAIVEMPEKSLLKLNKRGGVTIKADSLAISVKVDD